MGPQGTNVVPGSTQADHALEEMSGVGGETHNHLVGCVRKPGKQDFCLAFDCDANFISLVSCGSSRNVCIHVWKAEQMFSVEEFLGHFPEDIFCSNQIDFHCKLPWARFSWRILLWKESSPSPHSCSGVQKLIHIYGNMWVFVWEAISFSGRSITAHLIMQVPIFGVWQFPRQAADFPKQRLSW